MKTPALVYVLLIILALKPVNIYSQPYISSFTPTSGPVGTAVVISGINFSPVAAENKVFFGAVQATVTSASSTTLNVVVPYGANYEPITVNTNGLVMSSRNAYVVTFPDGGNINSTSFHEQVSFEAGDLVHEVVPCDIDLDGKPDIVTANNHNLGGFSSFSVLRNTTIGDSISFADHVDFMNGAQTYSVACGDLDGDGKPDVVASSIGNSGISIYKNTSTPGIISFGPAINYSQSDAPYTVAIADFDWDGRQDIVVVNSILTNSISIYRNITVAGNISFAPKFDLTTQLFPQAVIARDFNGDGRIDIVVTNKSSSSFSIFRNTSSAGTISFAARSDVSVGAGFQPVGLDVCDIGGDGKADLIVTCSGNSSGERGFAQVYKNTSGTSTVSFAFKTSVTGSTFESAFFTNSGDVNGDGKPDLVMGLPFYADLVKVFQNNYEAATDFYAFGPAEQFVAFSAYSVALCDLNADGRPEIISHFLSSNSVHILKNRCGDPGITSFSPNTGSTGTVVTINGHNLSGITSVSFGTVPASSFSVVSANQITATVAAGATGDVVVSGPTGSASLGTFGYFPSPEISSFTPTTAASGATITIYGNHFNTANSVSFGGVAATGINVISSTQLTAVVGAGASGNVAVTTAGGTAILPGFVHIPSPQISSFTPTSGMSGTVVTITGNHFNNVNSVSFGGTNAASFTVVNSTTIEAVVGGGSSGNVSVTTTGGAASLAGFTYVPFPTPVITSFTPVSAIPGNLMTIYGSYFGAGINQNVVYIGGIKAQVQSATSNEITAIIPTGAFVDHVSVTANNLTAISGVQFIPTFTSNQFLGAGSFATAQEFSTSGSNGQVVLADMDIDGKPDIITSSSILRNISSGGSFSFAAEYPLNTGSYFHPVDLNNDGKKDLFAINVGGPNTYIWKNNSTANTLQLSSQYNYYVGSYVYSIADGDFNNDGKTDIVLGTGDGRILIMRNLGTDNNIVMAAPQNFTTGGVNFVASADFDSDGKTDIAVLNASGFTVNVLRNTTTGTAISFTLAQTYPTRVDVSGQLGPQDIIVRDFNGDGKPDFAVANYMSSQTFSCFKNISSAGNIQFAARLDSQVTGFAPFKLGSADLDGDSKPDLIAVHGGGAPQKIAVLRNQSLSDPSFASPIPFTQSGTSTASSAVNAADLNGDGKPEIILRNNNKLLVYKNLQAEQTTLQACIGQSFSITTNRIGNSYQWQEDSGSGFVDLQNNASFTGVNSPTLQITSVGSYYGRKYRCIVDSHVTIPMTLRLTNKFIGAQSLLWNNPANWSCGIVPDENTDVILDLGSSIVNLNISVASITMSNYAYLRVDHAVQLTITR